MSSSRDRRIHTRHGLALNRSITAEIKSRSSSRTEPVYIIDISVSGIRVNTAFELPDDVFTLDANLDGVAESLAGKRLKLGLKAVWTRPLSGGSWVSGLELIEATTTNLDVLSDLIAFSAGPGGRRQFRLAQIMKVKLSSPSGLKWKTATCLDLSTRGLCVIIDSYLGRGDKLATRLCLPGFSDVQALAEVAWNREYFGRDMALGLRFTEISETAATTLQAFIDQQATK